MLTAREIFRDSDGIDVKSSSPDWIRLRIQPDIAFKEQVVKFFRSLISDLKVEVREKLSLAVHELLGNAMEHGCCFNRQRVVDFSFIRTARMILIQIEDAGPGFSMEALNHSAVNNPPEEPLRHLEYRSRKGMRPGGFGIMMVKQITDELIYNEQGNGVTLVQYLD